MSRPDLTEEGCRQRQQRLLRVMEEQNLSGVVLCRKATVQWLCGPRFGDHFDSLALLRRDGSTVLIAPHKEPAWAAADQVDVYAAKWLSTMRNDQAAAAAAALFEAAPDLKSMSRVGVEYSAISQHVREELQEIEDVDPSLFALRRQKGSDELSCLEFAIEATDKMYQEARQVIRPGITEIQVFNRLQTIAVETYGEALTGTGNDYQVNSRGGLPRTGMAAESGQLYILDLGPAYRGYFADNARTIAVDQVTDEQMLAWEAIGRVFEHVESTVKPGVSCRQLFLEVQQILDASPVGVFNHHLGHGIGLAPHEGPHLNPNWDDTFAVGDVFTAEPGLYDPEKLKAGMRLENDYVVTETGVRLLTPFPLDLKLD